jgi:hypothetical protein
MSLIPFTGIKMLPLFCPAPDLNNLINFSIGNNVNGLIKHKDTKKKPPFLEVVFYLPSEEGK